MATTAEVVPGIFEMRIRGTVDGTTVKIVSDAFRQLGERGACRIIVNLRETAFISSVAIGCFVGSLEQARRTGGDIVFAAVPSFIRRVLDTVGLTQIVRVANDTAEASGMFGAWHGSA